jgi:hypothetical protein
LCLRRGGDVAVDGQVSQERFDVGASQLARVDFVMEQNVATHPVDIGFLGANTVVLDAQPIAQLIEQARLVWRLVFRHRLAYGRGSRARVCASDDLGWSAGYARCVCRVV